MNKYNARFSRFAGAALVFVLAASVSGGRSGESPEPPKQQSSGAFHCEGSVKGPIDLTLRAPEQIATGVPFVIEGSVLSRLNLHDVSLSVLTEGAVQILGDPSIGMGSLTAGAETTFLIPVAFPEGHAAVHVELRGKDPNDENLEHVRRESFYAILREGRAITGTSGFLNLELQGIEQDYKAGLITEAEGRAKAKSAQKGVLLPSDAKTHAAMAAGADAGHPGEHFFGMRDAEAKRTLSLTAEQKALSVGLSGVPSEEDIARADRAPQELRGLAGAATITVRGTVQWLDETGTIHPAFGMTAQVRDDDTFGSELVALVATNANGQYSIMVDNDDGFGAGDRDIFVRFVTANNAVSVKSAGVFGSAYEFNSPIHEETPDGSVIVENYVCANTGTGPACSILTSGTYIAAYAARFAGFLGQIPIEWPGSSTAAFYNGALINMRPGDRWDWDVLHHEYGHYVMDSFNFEANPGGPHTIPSCIASTRGKDVGNRLAWGEGWPTFFGTAGQSVLNLAALNVPRVGDVFYADTGESSFSYSLETQDFWGQGEDNEIAVQRLFWDLFDSASDGRDFVSFTDEYLFNSLNMADATTLSRAWAAVRGSLSNQAQLWIGGVASNHFVGPTPTSPVNNATIASLTPTFSWAANVGCPGSYAGNSFDVIFYTPTFERILTIPGLSTTTVTLTAAQTRTLFSRSRNVIWAVEGRHTTSPATGPYLGAGNNLILDLGPTANAGGPYTTTEGTNVTLNGSGSSTRLGTITSYQWDLDNDGAFDDAVVAFPPFNRVGQQGVFRVRLRVTNSLGFSAEAETTVTVVNSSPRIALTPIVPRGEGTPVTLNGVVRDSGWLDTLSGTVQWGDGTSAVLTGVRENVRPDATLTFTMTHAYEENGTYNVIVSASDGTAAISATVTVAIANLPPQVDAGPDQESFEGGSVGVQAPFTDPGTRDTHEAFIDWGDGSPLVPGVIDGPPGHRTVNAVHDYETPGVYTVLVKVKDDEGDSGSDTFQAFVAPGFFRFCVFGESDATDLPVVTIASTGVAECSVAGRGNVRVNSASVGGHVLSSNRGVTLGPSGTVTGDVTAMEDVTIRNRSIVNLDVVSGRDVFLQRNATVRGNVSAVGAITRAPGVTVGGASTEGAAPPVIPALSPLAVTVTAGGANVTVPASGSRSLTPGSYGRLLLRSGARLNLIPGHYAFESVQAAANAVINLDLSNGPVVIDVVGNLTLATGVRILNPSPNRSAKDILFRIGGNATLGASGTYLGTFAAAGTVRLAADATLRGALLGQVVSTAARTTVHGEPALRLFVAAAGTP